MMVSIAMLSAISIVLSYIKSESTIMMVWNWIWEYDKLIAREVSLLTSWAVFY
jgi:hypothetical protein